MIHARLESDVNDDLAWGALTQRVRRWARAQLPMQPWEAIEDIVADTCSAVVMRFGRARSAESFSGFVYGFYLNERRRKLVEAQRRSSTQVDVTQLDIAQPVEDEVLKRDEFAMLWRALAELPARPRTAVSLRYFEQLSTAEIARELGVTPGNARQIVHVGMTMLRKRLSASQRNGDHHAAFASS